jgi:hypothetical protein
LQRNYNIRKLILARGTPVSGIQLLKKIYNIEKPTFAGKPEDIRKGICLKKELKYFELHSRTSEAKYFHYN